MGIMHSSLMSPGHVQETHSMFILQFLCAQVKYINAPLFGWRWGGNKPSMLDVVDISRVRIGGWRPTSYNL
jgi:hypothetical protein